MTIFYISTTGSDTTGDGSIETPYLSIGKCITVGVDGDTVKALNGTYTITSTIDVSKQISIISNSGVATDVIFDANCTIFNIQSSNVSITYVTCQSSSTSELVTIDRMSTGTTMPTFWTGINISNCILKYTGTALALNGTFTVNTNAFSRQGSSNVVDVIRLYSCRGASSISSNTLTDVQPIRYFIYLTSTGSGTYLDRCNSKGGSLTINSNNLTYTHASQSMTFIFQDYFNQYSYGTVGANEQYNTNTKLSGSFSSNTITSDNVKCVFATVRIANSTDLNSLGNITITGNTLTNTEYGVLHLDKNTSSHSVVSLASIVTKPMFKIYSNTMHTVSPYLDPLIWLRASELGLANGTQLDTWSSKSPATRTGTSYLSGNATIKPKYYNNEDYPFVRFSEGASGGQLTTNGSYINFGNNIPVNLNTVGSTFILIYRPRSLIEYDRFLGFSNGTNVGNGSPCVMTATNNGRLATVLTNNAPGNIYINSSYNLPSLNTWSYQIIRIKYNTVSITEPSGTTTSTNVDTTYCTNFNTTQALLGAFYWYNVLYCSVRIDVRDFLYYDVFLSDSETTQVINNLKAQYNM